MNFRKLSFPKQTTFSLIAFFINCLKIVATKIETRSKVLKVKKWCDQNESNHEFSHCCCKWFWGVETEYVTVSIYKELQFFFMSEFSGTHFHVKVNDPDFRHISILLHKMSYVSIKSYTFSSRLNFLGQNFMWNSSTPIFLLSQFYLKKFHMFQ